MFRTLTAAALLMLLSAPSMAQMRFGVDGMFERADANKDGQITREEFLAARAEQFGRLDRNSDGYADSSDMPKRLLERRQQNGGGCELIAQFDTNGDHRISKEEFVNGPAPVFDQADADRNGVLDDKELAAAKETAKAAAAEWRDRKQQ